MDEPLTVVYRSRRRRRCEERQLVLTAVGINAFIVTGAYECRLEVAAEDAPAALEQLAQYEAENVPPPPLPPAAPLDPDAWIGCTLYVLVLMGVAAALSQGLVRLDAFDVGELDSTAVQAGQWWRSLTALTLHVDGPHLAANLVAGVWFGYLAGRQMGVGMAWLVTVIAAGLANLAEALLGAPGHHSVGASTAVFAALGAMAAFSWRERLGRAQRWARRWAPLIAGVALLGWTGSAGEGTDVMAHIGGFVAGVLSGALIARPRVRAQLARLPQWLYGALALSALALAWALALRS